MVGGLSCGEVGCNRKEYVSARGSVDEIGRKGSEERVE